MNNILNNMTTEELEANIAAARPAIEARYRKSIKALNDDRPEDHDAHVELAQDMTRRLNEMEAELASRR